MCDDKLIRSFRITSMRMLLYLSNGQTEMFHKTEECYSKIVAELQEKIKNIPLEWLTELSDDNTLIPGNIDPELIPGLTGTISDVATSEIHRRAFLGYTIVPFRKEKIEGSNIGFLRKPKF